MSKTFLFEVIRFSQTVLIQTVQFSVSTVPFQTIKFSINKQFKCQNSSISCNSV